MPLPLQSVSWLLHRMHYSQLTWLCSLLWHFSCHNDKVLKHIDGEVNCWAAFCRDKARASRTLSKPGFLLRQGTDNTFRSLMLPFTPPWCKFWNLQLSFSNRSRAEMCRQSHDSGRTSSWATELWQAAIVHKLLKQPPYGNNLNLVTWVPHGNVTQVPEHFCLRAMFLQHVVKSWLFQTCSIVY